MFENREAVIARVKELGIAPETDVTFRARPGSSIGNFFESVNLAIGAVRVKCYAFHNEGLMQEKIKGKEQGPQFTVKATIILSILSDKVIVDRRNFFAAIRRAQQLAGNNNPDLLVGPNNLFFNNNNAMQPVQLNQGAGAAPAPNLIFNGSDGHDDNALAYFDFFKHFV